MTDHIDPAGREFGIACDLCGMVHTREEDEAVMARWAEKKRAAPIGSDIPLRFARHLPGD